MAEKKSDLISVEFTKDFTCYPDGLNKKEFKKGKQDVTPRVAKLAGDCKVLKQEK